MIFWFNEQWAPSGSLKIIKYLKIDYDGNPAIGWNPAGVNLSDPYSESGNLQIKTINEESGIICYWNQIGNFSDIYSQVIDWDGNQLWSTGGIVISDASGAALDFSYYVESSDDGGDDGSDDGSVGTHIILPSV